MFLEGFLNFRVIWDFMKPWFLFTVSCRFLFPLTARLPNRDVSGHLAAVQTQILSLILHAQSMHNRTQIFVSGGNKKQEEEEKEAAADTVLSLSSTVCLQ
jgi:hypothetical protein